MKWTILKEAERLNYKKRVVAQCECGVIKTIDYYSLKNGLTKSCGCDKKPNLKHSLSKSREYNSWNGMKIRCNNTNHKQYKDYGGRGITVCPEWLNSFEQFYKDMGPRPIGKTLDRINNNKGYEPSNCKWSTYSEQAKNKRKIDKI
jgi:hypothetical protein